MSTQGMMRFSRPNSAPKWAWACLLFTTVGSGGFTWAQRDSLSMDVTFIGDREMMLRDAHKILVWPEAGENMLLSCLLALAPTLATFFTFSCFFYCSTSVVRPSRTIF